MSSPERVLHVDEIVGGDQRNFSLDDLFRNSVVPLWYFQAYATPI
jgi:hypothetical protein